MKSCPQVLGFLPKSHKKHLGGFSFGLPDLTPVVGCFLMVYFITHFSHDRVIFKGVLYLASIIFCLYVFNL